MYIIISCIDLLNYQYFKTENIIISLYWESNCSSIMDAQKGKQKLGDLYNIIIKIYWKWLTFGVLNHTNILKALFAGR
jgi:hypothetical protein